MKEGFELVKGDGFDHFGKGNKIVNFQEIHSQKLSINVYILKLNFGSIEQIPKSIPLPEKEV